MRQLGSIRYEIIVPRTYNDGTAISENIFTAYRDELLAVFNGITQYDSITGYWQPPLDLNWELKCESNFILRLDAHKEIKDLYAAVFSIILERLRIELGQHSIHFTCFECDSFLVAGEEKDSPPSTSKLTPHRLYIFDKNGKIVAHGTIEQVGNTKLKDGDVLFLVDVNIVNKYRLDQLPAIGRDYDI